jgi:hypothetical protein
VDAPAGTACDDGSACTVNDACQAGSCRGGTELACDDGNECTEDVCQPASGCRHAPRNGESCAEGDGICRGLTCRPEPMGEGGAGATPSGGSGGASAYV